MPGPASTRRRTRRGPGRPPSYPGRDGRQVNLTVRVPAFARAALEREAEAEGLTLSEHVRQLLRIDPPPAR